MKKENILVTQSLLPSFEEYCEEIKELWETNFLTNEGPKHHTLELQLKEYLHADNVSLFTNGHLALHTAIKALKLEGEVITTPFTFISTTNALIENGLTPVFCDIKESDYTIDSSKIESLITPKTSAILAVHVYGNICDIEKIEQIAKKYKLKVIYDAAHAMSIKYKGVPVCNYGDISMLSFHATKVFNTIEGGALIYKDPALYKRLKALKNFGIDEIGNVETEGINAKMNEFQASMGICNLRILDSSILERKRIVERYNMHLSGIDGIILNVINSDTTSNYSYYPILFKQDICHVHRDEIFNELAKNGIYSRKYFYPIIQEFEYYKKIAKFQDTPIAKYVSENILCLPLSPYLESSVVDFICQIIIHKLQVR